LLRKNPQLPIIWDSVDCISYLFQQSAQYNKKLLSRWITRFELSRSRAYESRLIRLFNRVLVTSQVDRAALLSLISDQDKPAIDVLPNGVDLDYFRPVPHDQRDSETIVVSGKMSYHANIAMVVYMVEEIMPLVWAEKPQARLIIAGKDPPKRIRAMTADPRICVTGYIPDIRPYLQKAAIAAAPLTYGAGIQNKILEAMACATPVVTTSQGASALDASAGHDFLTAQTARDFASSLIQLMDHPDKAREIGLAGRHYVETRHDWLQKAADLLAIYREEIDRKRNTAHPIDSESDREIRQSYNKLSTR
jgi:glycosyltransferase involved in cell wall biosynthesis